MTLGGGNKSGLFQVLNTDYSPRVAAECMNRLAKLRWVALEWAAAEQGGCQCLLPAFWGRRADPPARRAGAKPFANV